MSLAKIPVYKLFKLQNESFEEYHNLLKHLEPKPIKRKGKIISSLTDLTFGEVAGLKMSFSDTSFESMRDVFKTVFGLKKFEFLNVDVINFYHALNWIREEMQSIYERERHNLTSTPDAKLKDAGIEDLNMFGELNTLIALGEKFSKPPQEVENWNYNLVFSLMLHQKVSNDINKRYQELNKPAND